MMLESRSVVIYCCFCKVKHGQAVNMRIKTPCNSLCTVCVLEKIPQIRWLIEGRTIKPIFAW